MATIDVSRQRASLLRDTATLETLPDELRLLIQDQSTNKFLDCVANAALTATDRIYAHFEGVFVR